MAWSKRPVLNPGFNKKRWWRRLILRALAIVVIILGVLIVAVVWVGRALPQIAANEISRLTNTRVEAGTFDFHRNASVTIDGFEVRPHRGASFDDETLLRAESVYVKFSLGSVLRLSPRLTEIRVQDFTVDVRHDLDTGQWNIDPLKLRTCSGGGGTPPEIRLERGRLRYGKVAGGKTEIVMSVPIEARFGLGLGPQEGYTFEIKTGRLSGGYGQSMLRGYWRPGELAFAGGLASTDIPSLERAWAVDVAAAQLTYGEDGAYKLDVRINNAHSKHTPEVDAFRALAPQALQQVGPLATLQRFFDRYRPSGTLGRVALTAAGNLARLQESRIQGEILCEDISIRDRRFPYAIDHLNGRIDLNQSTVTVNGLSGRHGDVTLKIQGWTRGYGDERQYQYRATSDSMTLDGDLYAALQPDHKRLWDAFRPTGIIGVDYRMMRTTPTDARRTVAVELKGVDARYRKFTYPLRELTGTLRFDRDSITVSDVVSTVGDRRIALNGEVTRRSSDAPLYYFSIDANNVPLNDTLYESLPPQHRKMCEQFDAVGVADVWARVFSRNDQNEVGPVSFLADVSLDLETFKPALLPFALTDVKAQAAVTPELLDLKRLDGRRDQSELTATGHVRFAAGAAGQQVQLRVSAENVAVDKTLVGMLPESLEKRVAAFHLGGGVDVTVDYRQVDGNAPPDYTVAVDCLANTIAHERFAYPLKGLRGTIQVDRNTITFDTLQGHPAGAPASDATPVVRLDGTLSLKDGSLSGGRLSVAARDIPFAPELVVLMPAAWARVYRDLAPSGPFDLDVHSIDITEVTDDETRVEFDADARFKTCSLTVSGAGSELCGVLRAANVYSTKAGLLAGRMELDAEHFAIRGKALTDLRAEVLFDPNTGRWTAEDFLGDCYDGRVLGDLRVGEVGDGVLRYTVDVAFLRVALEPFLLAGRRGDDAAQSATSGIMDAALTLGSRIGDGSSRLGLCRVDVVDMQVGKVSPLANLLSVLRLSEPTDYTFEQMLINSYLRRDKVLIQEFDMAGRNVAFTGSGTMDLANGQIDLTLTARGQRVAAANPSLLQSLTESLGGAVVRMEVSGPADHPEVETKTLPLIEDSLKILGTPR
jgi:hypothetical protein